MDGLTRRNYSIDYFKYFCALLIIVIHLKPFEVISKEANRLSVNTLPRIAVPFFFIVSGYFFADKLYRNRKPLKRYALKILTVYTVWSLLYALRLVLIEIKNHRLNAAFFKQLGIQYLFYGVSEHLWYCLSLLYAVCLLTLLYRLKLRRVVPVLSAVAYAVSVLGLTYYNLIGSKIPLLNSIYASEHFIVFFRLFLFGTSFVFLGAFLSEHREKLLNKTDATYFTLLAAAVLLHAAEKTLNFLRDDNLLLNITLYPLVMCIMLVLLKKGSDKESCFSPFARNASSFTYFSHLLLIDIFGYVIPYQPVRYVAVAATALAVAVLLTKINNKKLNYLLM